MVSLIVGLGNIGRRYHHTRHNLGFMVVEKLIRKHRLTLNNNHPAFAQVDWPRGNNSICLALPTEYMNRSGNAAAALLHMKGLSPADMLVIVDDFNLPLGSLRVRRSGSDGGHNGLASIIERLESASFPRLRLGIGPLPDDADIVDYVLTPFSDDEQQVVDDMIVRAVEAVETILDHGLDKAMSHYNEIKPA